MHVLSCLIYEHDWWIVALAALMSIVGSMVSVALFQRTISEGGPSRFHWCFLSAMTAGAATWATHFIGMLGYRAPTAVTFDETLTIASALIAVGGIGAGLLLATASNRLLATLAGGGTIGLSIAAMHYLGMYAYRVEGVVEWRSAYVAASLVIAVAFSTLMIERLRSRRRRHERVVPGLLLAFAIIGLHFTGMGAFAIMPAMTETAGMQGQSFLAVAVAVAMVALMIVGMGISTYLVEGRTHFHSQRQLAHIAMHDALTGLANRHKFTKALEVECAKLSRHGKGFALLMVDLDRFKPVNDTLGHPTGDLVLQRVAGRLREAMRERDLVARIGGDEFAIIAYGVTTSEQAEQLAGRVVEILSRPFVVNATFAELGGSVGVALAPAHGADTQELVQHADVALYSAKRAGKQRYCLFEAAMMDAMQRRRFVEVELRRACMREDFQVVYQPVVDTLTGAITGAEALLRWHCPGRGDVSPAEFIPIAEDLGLVSRIGAGVLREACKQAASWPGELDIAVNVSPVQLLDPRLPHIVSQALARSGLPAARLELEITETALFGDDEAALRTLNQLCDLGVRISLDDFGTGYSSLSYLHRFPISRIKVDQSFVRQLPEDAGSASIVRAIAQLGANLGMHITAEGIETSEQLSFIAQHGCDHAQGFLISRPVKPEAFVELLASHAASIAA